jgi:hypothetical protein
MKRLGFILLLSTLASGQEILIQYRDHPTEEIKIAIRQGAKVKLLRETSTAYVEDDIVIPIQNDEIGTKEAIKVLTKSKEVQFAEVNISYSDTTKEK